MDDFKNIPNPFPQLGTPTENVEIDPVGYDKELEEIRNLIVSNISYQPLIINIHGEYGQGKTTFLKFLKRKFDGSDKNPWGDYIVDMEDISRFPPLEQILSEKQKEAEENNKKGIIIILDEMQHISTEDKLSEGQKRFLNFLRRFADGNIEGVNSNLFTLILSMHPETEKFLKDYGFYDVEQRRGTYKVTLKDLDYFMAHEMIRKYFEKMHEKNKQIEPDYKKYFDEAFINAFYIFSQHVEYLLYDNRRINGRTFAQIFFILFEQYKKKGSKLTFDDLKAILLGESSLKFKEVPLTIDRTEYKDLMKMAEGIESKAEKFIFNPRWHIETEYDDINFLNILLRKGILSCRECIILEPQELSKFNFKKMEKERVYLNGEKWLVFVDFLKNDEKSKIEPSNEILKVYRLSDLYLERLYDFQTETGEIQILKEYYDSKPSKKVEKVYDCLLSKLVENNPFKELKKSKCRIGPSYTYIEGPYNILDKIEYKIAIFYYAENYNNDSLDDYLRNVIKELEDSDHDMALILICPYCNQSPPKENYEVRKMENRVIIDKLDEYKLKEMFNINLNPIIGVVEDSLKLYINEAVEKGFTLPLTGFKEKIENKPSLFKEKFISEIKRAWEIELKDREPEGCKILNNKAVDGDGKLKNLARESLKEFMKLDEEDRITGCKLSKYEKNFLNLFGSQKVKKKDLNSTLNRYFSSYSRFSIEDYISSILEEKNILKVEKEFYQILDPKDYIYEILLCLNETSLLDIVSDEENREIREKLAAFRVDLDELKNSSELTPELIGAYNTRFKSIIKILKGKTQPILDEDGLKKIKEKLESRFIDIKVDDIEIFNVPENYHVNEYFTTHRALKYDRLIYFINKKLNDISAKLNLRKNALNDLKTILNYCKECGNEKIKESTKQIFHKLEKIENLKNLELEQIKQIGSKNHIYFFNQVIKEVNNILDHYITVLRKVKDTWQFIEEDISQINKIEPNIPIKPEEELDRIKKIAKYHFPLLESYVKYVSKNYKILREKLESKKEEKEFREFFESLNIFDTVPEEKLKEIIKDRQLNFDRLQNLAITKIIEKLMEREFLKRIIISEEYYRDCKLEREEQIKYEKIKRKTKSEQDTKKLKKNKRTPLKIFDIYNEKIENDFLICPIKHPQIKYKWLEEAIRLKRDETYNIIKIGDISGSFTKLIKYKGSIVGFYDDNNNIVTPIVFHELNINKEPQKSILRFLKEKDKMPLHLNEFIKNLKDADFREKIIEYAIKKDKKLIEPPFDGNIDEILDYLKNNRSSILKKHPHLRCLINIMIL